MSRYSAAKEEKNQGEIKRVVNDSKELKKTVLQLMEYVSQPHKKENFTEDEINIAKQIFRKKYKTEPTRGNLIRALPNVDPELADSSN